MVGEYQNNNNNSKIYKKKQIQTILNRDIVKWFCKGNGTLCLYVLLFQSILIFVTQAIIRIIVDAYFDNRSRTKRIKFRTQSIFQMSG